MSGLAKRYIVLPYHPETREILDIRVFVEKCIMNMEIYQQIDLHFDKKSGLASRRETIMGFSSYISYGKRCLKFDNPRRAMLINIISSIFQCLDGTLYSLEVGKPWEEK